MCLEVNSKEQIAKTDILVYKIIFNDNKSLYEEFQYEPNKLYRFRKKLVIEVEDGDDVIYRGFHSYCDIYTAIRYSYVRTCKVVEFTIPKGAKYYLGLDNEIVSTSIRSSSLEPISY